MSDCCQIEAENRQQRRLLWTVLILNAGMFVLEFAAGWVARSSGLLADSLDMLADALVYGLSLYAVGRGVAHKARAALVNGSLQLMLGLGVFVHLGWRIWSGTTPQADMMGGVAVLALVVNITCFGLLYRFRGGDVNLRASWICSRNDMLANVGVLVAAGMVVWLKAPWPDWLIGGLIGVIVVRSALGIIAEARTSLRTGEATVTDCCASEKT